MTLVDRVNRQRSLTEMVTQAGGWSYVWDYLNRMLASGYNNSTTTYAYDQSGARVLQTSTTSTTYYPSKYFSLASTTSGGTSWATSTNYIWLGDTLLGTIDQKLYNGTATGTAITRYVHPDHLGSTNVVTDASGTIAQLFDYYPYGATRVSSTTFPTNEKRQYIGQFADAQTNLNYLNARYYEGSRGQFLSEDPTFWKLPKQLLADPQQFNSYSYARDNPITMKDPTGESSIYSWATDPYGSLFYTGSLGSVAAMSQATDLPATAMLLSHSLSLNPGPLYAGNGSVLTNAITSNSLYQSSLQKLLNDASAQGQTSITNAQLPLNFKQGDAATSFGKIDIYINATRGKDGSWQVSGSGSDVYDFQYMQYKNKVFSTINNTAYFGQNQGAVSNFTTYVNFSQTISPSKTFTTPSGAVVRWDGTLVSGAPQKK